jgi:hypothetical protein
MEKNQIIVLVLVLLAAVAATLLGGPEGIYVGLVIVVVDLVLLMGFVISNTSKTFKKIPKLTAHLKEDAKGVIIRNHGERVAVRIHTALVPINIEFDVPRLDPGQTFEFATEEMIPEAKAVMTYEDDEGAAYSHSTHLAALGIDEEEDLLKPAFPMFDWK